VSLVGKTTPIAQLVMYVNKNLKRLQLIEIVIVQYATAAEMKKNSSHLKISAKNAII